MHATVIDTLRYADRLKQAGLESGQAEAMSRALNDELTEGLVTRTDLDEAVSHLTGEIGNLGARVDTLEGTVQTMGVTLEAKVDAIDAKFEAKFEVVDGRFDAMDSKFNAMDTKFDAMDSKFNAMDSKFDAMDSKFDAMDSKFNAMDTKFGAMDTKFGALRSQLRYVLLVLALVVGLGLYNATVPHFLGVGGHQPTEPDLAIHIPLSARTAIRHRTRSPAVLQSG